MVADEVRKLAEKTMAATKEVSESIASIQEGASQSIAAVQTASKYVMASAELANRSDASLRVIAELVEGNASQVEAVAASKAIGDRLHILDRRGNSRLRSLSPDQLKPSRRGSWDA